MHSTPLRFTAGQVIFWRPSWALIVRARLGGVRVAAMIKRGRNRLDERAAAVLTAKAAAMAAHHAERRWNLEAAPAGVEAARARRSSRATEDKAPSASPPAAADPPPAEGEDTPSGVAGGDEAGELDEIERDDAGGTDAPAPSFPAWGPEMSRAELIAAATARGINVGAGMSKAKLLESLEAFDDALEPLPGGDEEADEG